MLYGFHKNKRWKTNFSSLVAHTVVNTAFGSHPAGENNYWKLSDGSTYPHLWYRGKQYTSIVYTSTTNSDGNYSIYAPSLSYDASYSSGLGLTDIGVRLMSTYILK